MKYLKKPIVIVSLIGFLAYAALGSYAGYGFFQKKKAQYQRQGFNTTLQAIVQGIEQQGEITIRLGDKILILVAKENKDFAEDEVIEQGQEEYRK